MEPRRALGKEEKWVCSAKRISGPDGSLSRAVLWAPSRLYLSAPSLLCTPSSLGPASAKDASG